MLTMTNGDAIEAVLETLGNPELTKVEVHEMGGGTPQACFGNAAQTAATRPGWKMVLGRMVLVFDNEPDVEHSVRHAWVVDPEGVHHDPTPMLDDGEGITISYEGFVISVMEMWQAARKYRRCEATTQTGRQCKCNAIFGDDRCGRHGGMTGLWVPDAKLAPLLGGDRS